jgi:hypothetical protein
MLKVLHENSIKFDIFSSKFCCKRTCKHWWPTHFRELRLDLAKMPLTMVSKGTQTWLLATVNWQ